MYCAIFLAVFGFVFASVVLQSSITSVFRSGSEGKVMSVREGLTSGSSLKFFPSKELVRRLNESRRLDQMRSEARIGVRPPSIALVSFS